MSFSRKASANVVPLLSRLILAAAFIPAGWDKIMGEPAVYTGDQARTLQKLGIGEPLSAPDLAEAGQDVLGSYQQDVETGRLRDRVGGRQDEPATEPAEKPAPAPAPRWQPKPAPPPAETPKPEPPAVEEPVPEPTPPKPEPKPVPEPPQPKPKPQPQPEPPAVDAGQDDGPAVKARRLYRVALMLDAAGWPQKLKPGWLAWAAAGTEAVGGALILIGLFSRVWGLGLAVTMGFAFWLTSWAAVGQHGFFSLPIADFNQVFAQLGLFVLAAGVMMTGAGGLSLDRALFRGGADDSDEHLLHLG
ncbi:MAG: DoxX family protein [Planctomycetota bacterium]|jgi:uncharacterized membrane protein YphA (DoxX/SURF4 family)